ncbi:hypothetical protein EXD82_00730 [Peptacetobacter hominis]|uniref:Uncharacterized protein n=1 Tax=Peptacetobacter hominis TaxID=2743610 RepID=A0A544QYK3_9FIRM|nr:hypothetical protein [Peptacetobacter hominis]TQQ85771.1 hypothetical protein EXD82_00730 [Peptacetobacter hominis]
MIDRVLDRIGKDRVFSVMMLVVICINIFIIGRVYTGYETFLVDNQRYRYMGTDGNTSKIRCEDGTEYELIETRRGEERNTGIYMEGRYNSDYILKSKDNMATYISTNDSHNTIVMKLFNNKEFRIDDKLQSELLKSVISISKETGELKYDFKYEDQVPFEYKLIESAIMYHSSGKEMLNFYSMIFVPFLLTFIGVILFVYPKEILGISGVEKLQDGFLMEFIVFIMRIIGVVGIILSFYIKDI